MVKTQVNNTTNFELTARWGAKLRVAEKLVCAVFGIAVFASLVFPLNWEGRLRICALNSAVWGTVILLSRYSEVNRCGLVSSIRDWFPCVLIPLAYRESGLFFSPDPTHRLDHLFIGWDQLLLQNSWSSHAFSLCAAWLLPYLELSYLLCYPLVPLGLGTIIWARHRGALKPDGRPTGDLAVDRFWTAVLLAVFTCYVAYPFFPLTPPRVLFPDLSSATTASALRELNLWLLHRNGDQASLFPSGHVASVMATALAVRAALPRVGWIFLVAAASVTAATVVGRYHYAADAVAGMLVGVSAFVIAQRIHQP